jgi:flagellar hook-length control protein FliK
MNLSALNSGLSQANNPISTEVNDLGALSRPSSGTQSGEDFAAFLRQQIASLKSAERQEIATEAAPLPSDKPSTKATKSGLLEQQALRQAFHPGRYLHAKTPSSKGMGMLSPGGHYAKPLPATRPAEHPRDNPSIDKAEHHQTQRNQQLESDHNDDDRVANDKHAQAKAWSNQKRADMRDAQGYQDEQALQSIALSPEVEIITVAQPATSEKSLTDFALAMGLDASQIQALLGDAASAEVVANSPAATTQQMLAMNTGLNAVNPLTAAAVSLPNSPLNPLSAHMTTVSGNDGAAMPTSAVLSQGLPVAPDLSALTQSSVKTDALASNLLTPIDMQVQWSSASADIAADKQFSNLQNLSVAAVSPSVETPDNVSTLAVLSMLDADLRPEDVDRLKEEFDKLSAIDDSTSSHEGASSGSVAGNRSAPQANASPAQALKNHPDMAQTFEKLSQKLATELASRMNDQLNAGEWKMKFALKPASLGLVDVQLEMRDGQLSAQFQTDNGLTKDLIQNGSTRLKEALAELGMNNAYVSVGQDNRQSSQGGAGQSGQRRTDADNRVTLGDPGVGEQENTAAPARHSNSALFDTFA